MTNCNSISNRSVWFMSRTPIRVISSFQVNVKKYASDIKGVLNGLISYFHGAWIDGHWRTIMLRHRKLVDDATLTCLQYSASRLINVVSANHYDIVYGMLQIENFQNSTRAVSIKLNLITGQ